MTAAARDETPQRVRATFQSGTSALTARASKYRQILSQWTIPVVISRDGLDAEAGEDGQGHEFAYTRTRTRTPPPAPDANQPYDSPAAPWTDGLESVDGTFRYSWVTSRTVPGQPAKGDPRPAPGEPNQWGEWREPAVHTYAPDDPPGLEQVYALTAANAPAPELSNDARYDIPPAPWVDPPPSLTPELPIRWRAERRVPGDVQRGDMVEAEWSPPFIDGTYGEQGRDGQGYEAVYSAQPEGVIPPSPSNQDTFDRPTPPWFDGAPDLTPETPVLWRSQRTVPGGTPPGAEPTVEWGDFTEPQIVGRYGLDGPGGVGFDEVFATTALDAAGPDTLPDDDWGYASPTGDVWSTDPQSATATEPLLWQARRMIFGMPDVGDPVAAPWSAPAIVGRMGGDGPPGYCGVGRLLPRNHVPGDQPREGEFAIRYVTEGNPPVATNRANLYISWGSDLPYLRAVPVGSVFCFPDGDVIRRLVTTSASSYQENPAGELFYTVEVLDGPDTLADGQSVQLECSFAFGDPGFDAVGLVVPREYRGYLVAADSGGFSITRRGGQNYLSIDRGDVSLDDYFRTVGEGDGVWLDGNRFRWRATITGPGTRRPRQNAGINFEFPITEIGYSISDLVPTTAVLTRDTSYGVTFTHGLGAGTVAVPPSATVPAPPRNLAVNPDGQTVLVLSWQAPENDGGEPIIGYRIQTTTEARFGPSGGGWTDLVLRQTGTTYRHIGLSASERRFYRVFASNELGEGAASNEAEGRTVSSNPQAPAAPRHFALSPQSESSLGTSWRPPESDGGDPITSYQMQWSQRQDYSSPDGDRTLAESARGYVIPNLKKDTPYYIRLRARNSTASGEWTERDYEDAGPAEEGTPPGAPRNVRTTAGRTTIAVNWDVPSYLGSQARFSGIVGGPSQYEVVWSQDEIPGTGAGEPSLEGSAVIPATRRFPLRTLPPATNYTIMGLRPGTRYYVFVRAGRLPASPYTPPVEVTTIAADIETTTPSAPRDVAVYAPYYNALEVSWGTVASNGGASITRYQLAYSTVPFSASHRGDHRSVNAPNRSYTEGGIFSHIRSATLYYVRVRARNSSGWGLWSKVVSVTTPALPGGTAFQITRAFQSGSTVAMFDAGEFMYVDGAYQIALGADGAKLRTVGYGWSVDFALTDGTLVPFTGGRLGLGSSDVGSLNGVAVARWRRAEFAGREGAAVFLQGTSYRLTFNPPTDDV